MSQLLWRGKLLILASTLVCGAAAFGVSELFPRQYKASVLISPVVRDARQNLLSGRLGSLAGLAELTGLTDATSGTKAEAIATLQSEVLTEKYIRDNNLLPVIYAQKWDASRKVWLETDPKKIPTLWKANRYFAKGIRTVIENRRTNLVTLTISWTDPTVAATWANGLVALTNDYMRQGAMRQSTTNMDYLNEQAAKTTDVFIRQTIYNLMESELKNAMIARGDPNYALKVIDPAVPPERPYFPVHSFFAAGGMLAGLLLSVSYVLRRRKPPKATRFKADAADAKIVPTEGKSLVPTRVTTVPMWHLDVKL